MRLWKMPPKRRRTRLLEVGHPWCGRSLVPSSGLQVLLHDGEMSSWERCALLWKIPPKRRLTGLLEVGHPWCGRSLVPRSGLQVLLRDGAKPVRYVTLPDPPLSQRPEKALIGREKPLLGLPPVDGRTGRLRQALGALSPDSSEEACKNTRIRSGWIQPSRDNRGISF